MHKLRTNLLAASVAADPSIFEALLRASTKIVSYGRDPHDVAPPAGWAPYQPEHIAILYLRIDPLAGIDVNHAAYEMPTGNDEASRLAKALEVLTEKVKREVTFGEQTMVQNHGPYRHQLHHPDPDPLRLYDSGVFDDFGFASQNEIFIYLHHPRMNLDVDPQALISFKSLGNDGLPRNPNYAFFHAREVQLPTAAGDLGEYGNLLRIENYYSKEDGSLLQAADRRNYSMDIRFQVNAGPAGPITILIDPDTGNGLGYEP